jgi:putative transposase
MGELVATAQPSAGAVPVTRVCQALALNHATYDRWQLAKPGPDQEMAWRAQIQAIALVMPTYGYRRLAYERLRRGFVVNHKRVLHLMREDHVRCLRKQDFVRTMDSVMSWPSPPIYCQQRR